MGEITFNNRKYTVTDQSDKVLFKDRSDQEIKINFSFSKDKNKNKIAKDGLTIFFTEAFS